MDNMANMDLYIQLLENITHEDQKNAELIDIQKQIIDSLNNEITHQEQISIQMRLDFQDLREKAKKESAKQRSRIAELEERILYQTNETANLERSLDACRAELAHYTSSVVPSLQAHAKNLEALLMTRQEELRLIHESRGWKLLRKYYDLKDFLKGVRKSKETKMNLQQSILDKKISKLSVSVVIPTKNAGADFERTLSFLSAQTGIKALEIIIVDSGSTDNTLDIAIRYSAKVTCIKPEEFSHSFARNLGVSKASHKYTLVMTQDAIPSSLQMIRNMFKFMIGNNLSAVSCLEYPGDQCDLLYSMRMWNHKKVLGFSDHEDFIGTPPLPEAPLEMRKAAAISDVCCLYVTSVLRKFKYAGDYAEDLNLGLRLIEKGHKLGIMSTCRIIHSHKRLPIYELKRAFVDSSHLIELLPGHDVYDITPENLAKSILYATQRFSRLKRLLLQNDFELCSVDDYISCFEQIAKASKKHRKMEYFFEDKEFTRFIKDMSGKSNASDNYPVVWECFMGSAGELFDFLKNTQKNVDEEFFNIIIYTFEQLMALRIGALMADSYHKYRDKFDAFFNPIIQFSGV
jgi:glycosyltransferase involved in cell wall biosynthesis